MSQDAIDTAIQHYYTHQFDENARLTTRSAQSALEFIRVQEIVGARIGAEARVIDIGGGTGVHAAALAEAGHRVVLVDPVVAQVEIARGHGTFSAQVGDARRLAFADDMFDAAVLFGPLYHLRDRADRLAALREAARVTAPGGHLFAAAIPRLARHAQLSAADPDPTPYPDALVALLAHGIPTPDSRFPAGHFHTAASLEQELRDAGLADVEVHAIEGAAGLVLEQVPAGDRELLEAALTIARRTGHLPAARELSNHLLALARVP